MDEPHAAPLLTARNLSLSFGVNQLFEHADLDVFAHESLAIIGESGSGKSVLLKMFIGLLEPDEGELCYRGEDVGHMNREQLAALRRDVGYVFQNDALFDSMTIHDNVAYGLREHSKTPEDELRQRVSQCLEMVGLDPRVLEQYPSDLSGGMRKRVGLARAIAHRPKVILYDEPTQGLDPQNITRIGEMIRSLQSELSATSVIVTHDMRIAFTVCDRIALLHERRFTHIGTPRDFVHDPPEPVREFIADALDELQQAFAGQGQPLADAPEGDILAGS